MTETTVPADASLSQSQSLPGSAEDADPSRRLRRWRRIRERLVQAFVSAVAFSGIAAVCLIFVFIAREALPLFLDEASRDEAGLGKMFLPQVAREGRPATFTWQPVSRVPKVSMIPLIIGTLKVTFVAMLAAVPVAIAAAIYASEFASRRVREVLKPLIELLAGIPSVVLGFFALMVLASVLQNAFGFTYQLNAVVAGLALSLALIPVIFTVCEDALTAVPRSYREASLALGATRWETAWKVVLPAAAPGIVAACILGFGRAIGETMIVLMASGNAAIVSWDLTESVRSMSATIAAEMGEVVTGSTHHSLLFFIGVQLFAFTFVLNLAAGRWVRRFMAKLSGKGAA